jgi:hypothetical protein
VALSNCGNNEMGNTVQIMNAVKTESIWDLRVLVNEFLVEKSNPVFFFLRARIDVSEYGPPFGTILH